MTISQVIKKFEFHLVKNHSIKSEILFRRSLLQTEDDVWFMRNIFKGSDFKWFFVQKQASKHLLHK